MKITIFLPLTKVDSYLILLAVSDLLVVSICIHTTNENLSTYNDFNPVAMCFVSTTFLSFFFFFHFGGVLKCKKCTTFGENKMENMLQQ